MKQISIKYFGTIFLFSLGALLFAMPPDSLFIKEVEIKQTRNTYHSEEFRISYIDTSFLKQNLSSNLGELLFRTKAINILGYGTPGALNTISMRGTGSSHTQINWNGFPLNSLTTGVADLSLIPVSFFNDVSIIYGGSGSVYGNGAFGGAINLRNNVSWKNEISIRSNLDFGSFGNRNFGLNISVGGRCVHYSISSFLQNSDNDFPYTDIEKSGSPELTLQNNQTRNIGFLQELHFKFPKSNYLELGNWYQVKSKNIPSVLGSYKESLQEQTDSSFKFFLKWKKLYQRSSFEIRSVYLSDYLRYMDKELDANGDYLIDSEIQTNQFSIDANYHFFFSADWNAEFGGNWTSLIANVSSYGQAIHENRGNIISTLNYKRGSLDVATAIRFHFSSFEKPPPLYSFSAKYRFFQEHAWIRGYVSSKYRLPGLNDKYWQPGGNPDLLPEKGWSADLGTGLCFGEKGHLANFVEMDLHLFTAVVDNWIQWIPDNSYWRPINYKEVWSRGIESSLKHVFHRKSFNIELGFDYSYTVSTVEKSIDDNHLGKQLRYMPNHIFKTYISIGFLNFYS
ncbi:MAG: TonB-dependent receptor plug domain-containing protein, partial [Bacteroidota bacterium]|nr:TonB-dependent receptor plug domain-containing protein [Bacteroidota bacterium]